jgi:hypothetical protein
MSLFATDRLAVSLPAAEIATLHLPGSVMTASQVQALHVSHALGCAIALIEAHCAARAVTTSYLARPEIFTHGASAAWLRDRLGGVTEHLCISDGSTVKHVVGCRTHMFLYRTTHTDSYESFGRLCRRTPGLLARVETQVNSRFAWDAAGRRQRPQPVYLHAPAPPETAPAAAYKFQFKPYLADETSQRIAEADPVALEALPPAAQTIYIPLTETSLADAAFARHVAGLIRAAFVQPHARLLLRLPDERPGETLAARIAACLKALAATRVVLPRNTPPNICFVTADLTAATAPPNLFITLPEDFDFWRHPQRFYAAATSITVAASRTHAADPEFLPLDVTPIYGPRATRQWLTPPRTAQAGSEFRGPP